MILTYRQCLEKYGTDYRIKKAIEAGREAYLAKLGRVLEKGGTASSPMTGLLRD